MPGVQQDHPLCPKTGGAPQRFYRSVEDKTGNAITPDGYAQLKSIRQIYNLNICNLIW